MKKVEIVNLTPHVINVIAHESYIKKGTEPKVLLSIQPSGMVARVRQDFKLLERVDFYGVPLEIASLSFNGVTGVPPQQKGTLYAVSKLVGEALKGKRNDLIVMYNLYKQNGKIIGCRSFTKI